MMSYLLSMLAVLGAGVVVLVAGNILMGQESGESFQCVIRDSFVWGLGFAVSFGTEFLVLLQVL